MPALRVRVPATSANLGPGFDCLGLAVGLYNEMTFAWGASVSETRVEVRGHGEGELAEKDNAALAAFRMGLSALGHAVTPVELGQDNAIPLARGLGSSASAIVAGLAAACCVARWKRHHAATELDHADRAWLLHHALLVEPHPDNIAAAIYGGFTASLLVDESSARCLSLGAPPNLSVAFAVPSFHVSTQEARGVLPHQYTREAVVFSASRAAILVGALLTGAHDWLEEAVRDRIHTPARAVLIPGWKRVCAAARDSGALGVFISGSGPTVGAFAATRSTADGVARAMVAAFESADVRATAYAPGIVAQGVTVKPIVTGSRSGG